MSQVHINKFWSCFPNPPAQPAVGDSPQVYLAKLNGLCKCALVWPIGHPTGQLTRAQLRAVCRDPKVDVLIAYAAVMAWGGRGVDSRNYRLSLSTASLKHLIPILEWIRNSTNNRQVDFAAMQQTAKNIKGLGISFYTKLLFFFRKEPDAYILDQFTAKSAKLLFDPCQVVLNSSGYPDPKNTSASYDWFCTSLEVFGKSHAPVQWSGEHVETAMFDVRGGAWRKYLRSIYGKTGTKKPKNALSAVPITLPLTQPQHVAKGATPAAGGGTSLPALVASTHAAAYRAGCNLPGSSPQVGTAFPVRVHCSLNDGVIWQYAFQQKSIHAQVFIPPQHVARYNALRRFLGVTNHDFGDNIVGTGAKIGKTRSLKLTMFHGLNAPQNEWNAIAQKAVSTMALLFDRVCEQL